MAYNINLSNGTTLISGGLTDGTIDQTNSSLTLVGKNYPGYGVFLNQNFVQLIENFARSSAPTAPLVGQLWWDSGVKVLKVNAATAKGTSNSAWKVISMITSSRSYTGTPVVGEQWWDSTNLQLKVWSGSTWTIIGPAGTSSTGNTGAVPDTIAATAPIATYVVLKFYIDNVLVGIWSKEANFSTSVLGFASIGRGLNLSTAITQAFYGNADVANNLNYSGVSTPATSFLRNDQNGTINGSLSLTNDTGIKFGTASNFEGYVSSNDVILRNVTNNGNLVLSVKSSSVNTPFLKGNAISGLPEAYANPTSGSSGYTLATKDYVDTLLGGGTGTAIYSASLVPSANLTYNLGSTTSWWNNLYVASIQAQSIQVSTFTSSIRPSANLTYDLGGPTAWWNTIYGTSVHAKYADLAERFEADQPYLPGTIVGLGGAKEITVVTEELSEEVFGVISTKAAYLMNSGAGSDSTHPPVAVQGRVPVKVVGRIRKGDRLVAAGNGLARAGAKHELTPWNVFGRSLEDKNTDGEGTVEAIVKLNS